MSVGEFLQRHEDRPNSTLPDGKIVHPMNVIDIPLDYITLDAEGTTCGSVIQLPTDVVDSSLGHQYQKFLRSTRKGIHVNNDMISDRRYKQTLQTDVTNSRKKTDVRLKQKLRFFEKLKQWKQETRDIIE